MSDILEELSAARRADAELAEKTLPMKALESRICAMPPAIDFVAAFEGGRNLSGKPRVISELKKASPSEGMIREDFRPAELARSLAANGATALSVLAEPHRFLGDAKYVEQASRAAGLPVLFKDFVTTRYQVAAARAAGASAVLLIAAVLGDKDLAMLHAYAAECGLAALVETHTSDEVLRAVDAGAKIVGVNCRDLRTFRTDTAITRDLIETIPSGCVRIAESGIKAAEDIVALRKAGADGFLIGTTLMRAPDPGAKLAELIGVAR